MKRNALIVLLSGLVIMIIAICLEESMLNQLNSTNGSCGLNKIVLTAQRQSGSDNSSYPNLDDINYLAKKLPGSNLSYLARQYAIVEGNHNTAQVKVLGTNERQIRFNYLDIEAGGMWTREAEREGQQVAVISADLAARLYGSADVKGVEITIQGRPFLITGVFKSGAALLDRLTADGIPEVYIPGEAFYKVVQNPFIREIQIESSQQSNNDVAESISNLLAGMGKVQNYFAVIDYHPTRLLMEQVPKIQIFIIGVLVILVLLDSMKQNTRHIVGIWRKDSRQYYFSTIIKKRWREIITFLILTVGLLLIILFIWNRIHFSLYIPSRYIPNEMIDVSHFMEVIKQDISNAQELAEYYQPELEAQLRVGRVFNHCLYYIIWPLGLGLVLYAGCRIKKKVGKYYEEKIFDYFYDLFTVNHGFNRLRGGRKPGDI